MCNVNKPKAGLHYSSCSQSFQAHRVGCELPKRQGMKEGITSPCIKDRTTSQIKGDLKELSTFS